MKGFVYFSIVSLEMSVKVLNPSSPLRFSTHVSGCFIISMTPWRIYSAFRSTLQSIFCIFRVFQHVRPAGLFRAASVIVFCHCLLPWFFTPTASCPRFFVLDFLFSFILSIFILLPSPSMLPFHTLAPFANCSTTNAQASLSRSQPPPPPLQWRHIC